MNEDLEALVDRTRIIETINRLFIGTDNRDWSLVKDCFAPKVHYDMSSMGAGPPVDMTREQIVAAWDEGLKPLQAIHHQAGNHLVQVLGERATAFCYGIAMHYLPNPTGTNVRTFVGSYDFELAKEEGDWLITAFRFNLKYLDGNRDLEAS